MLQLLKRTAAAAFGLLVFSWGCYLILQANIGADPWLTLSMGLSGVSGLSIGDISVLTSLVIVVIDVLLKEKIGIATILDAILVGKFIDMFTWLGWVPTLHNFAAGIAVLLAGQVFLSIGSYFYIKPGLGCGPRDSLMVAIGKRIPKFPIGVARGGVEGAALLIGWLLGAKVGIGTVIAIFGISFILDWTFRLLRFDVRAVSHEDAIASFRNLLRGKEETRTPSS